ncbi:MAG TPA: hypothetical protein VIN40_01090 [Candidatus Tyrphobacter sp.]
MVTRVHLGLVARDLKKRLGNRAFLTIRRAEITQSVREFSGEDSTRVKSIMGQELEQALLEQGVRCFPSLSETSEEAVRLFHAGTFTGAIIDMLRHPAAETDRELAVALTKLKGRWNWTESTEHPIETLPERVFEPVNIRGEALSATVLRDRR